MAEHKGLPIQAFSTPAAWQTWLVRHGSKSQGIWMKIAKQASGIKSVSKSEAIQIALAHGWIDGQLDRLDERYWLTRFTPRGPRSKWSQINRKTAVKLIADGLMTTAGLAEVDKAKKDGRWNAAYEPQSQAKVPDDLQMALDANPTAKRFFSTLRGANRYAILYRIHDAKTAATRSSRIERFVSMLERGETLH